MQRGHLLSVFCGLARGNDVPRWLILPRWVERSDALPTGILHDLDRRDDVHCVHGGLLHRDGQHDGDGDALHAWQVLPAQLHLRRRLSQLRRRLLLSGQCQCPDGLRRGQVRQHGGPQRCDVHERVCRGLLHCGRECDDDFEPVPRRSVLRRRGCDRGCGVHEWELLPRRLERCYGLPGGPQRCDRIQQHRVRWCMRCRHVLDRGHQLHKLRRRHLERQRRGDSSCGVCRVRVGLLQIGHWRWLMHSVPGRLLLFGHCHNGVRGKLDQAHSARDVGVRRVRNGRRRDAHHDDKQDLLRHGLDYEWRVPVARIEHRCDWHVRLHVQNLNLLDDLHGREFPKLMQHCVNGARR